MLAELNSSKVCFLIIKIREFDVQAEENEGGGSNATDDGFAAVYDDEKPGGPVETEIAQFVHSMNADERRELVALSLVGRGEFGANEWSDALQAVSSRPELASVKSFLENPELSDELEEGLAAFDLNCDDFDANRL